MNQDVVIIGAGPAGIFTALEMLKKGSRKKILIVEKGRAVEDRRCPKGKTGQCVNCKPYCHITTGFSGAGAFSDGKLSLSCEVGGDLPNLVGADLIQETIHYTDQIYLEFGADSHIEGLGNTDEVKAIRKRAIQAGLRLVDCPIRHLGTEKAQDLYYAIEQYLLQNGVELLFGYECTNLLLEGDVCRGVCVSNGREEREILAACTVIATGRRGADWLESLCAEHNIAHQPGTVDIGVRVEVRNEVMETVNRVLYESKLVGYPKPFKNKVRTFCQNPGGFVSQENYDNDLAVVNGHSYKELKSDNTNLAILCSHNFSHPFNQPIAYAQRVGELTNMLGAGHIMVQRFGDILDQHHPLHPGHGPGSARLRLYGDAAVFPGAEILLQPGEDGRGTEHQYNGALLPGRLQRVDPWADDGLRHGRAHGPQAGGGLIPFLLRGQRSRSRIPGPRAGRGKSYTTVRFPSFL